MMAIVTPQIFPYTTADPWTPGHREGSSGGGPADIEGRQPSGAAGQRDALSERPQLG